MSKLADFLANGGPAFPVRSVPLEEGGQFFAAGMSLRDWFAGQALAGMTAGAHGSLESMDGLLASADSSGISVHEVVARAAYIYADAMLLLKRAQP